MTCTCWSTSTSRRNGVRNGYRGSGSGRVAARRRSSQPSGGSGPRDQSLRGAPAREVATSEGIVGGIEQFPGDRNIRPLGHASARAVGRIDDRLPAADDLPPLLGIARDQLAYYCEPYLWSGSAVSASVPKSVSFSVASTVCRTLPSRVISNVIRLDTTPKGAFSRSRVSNVTFM